MKNFEILAKTLQGLEPILADEISALGGKDIKIMTRAVCYQGNMNLLMQSNLYLRTAIRILLPLETFYAHDEGRLYKRIKRIEWEDWFKPGHTILLDALSFGRAFKNSHYVALKCKDAIADRFMEHYGERPSVDKTHPDIRIHIHIIDRKCQVSLDSSGLSLEKRGYKTHSTEAPISEVLAAGMLKIADWPKETPFIDPMCGSGTLAIEAAMMQAGIAPGARRHFAFENWNSFDYRTWQRIKKEAQDGMRTPENPVYASDINMKAIEACRSNAQNAGVDHLMQIKNMDFFQSYPQTDSGMLVMNPPYGERLDEDKDIPVFYKKIGDHLKQHYSGHTAWIFSGNKTALKQFGLRSSEKHSLLNGAIECKFHRYDLYTGSKKAGKSVSS